MTYPHHLHQTHWISRLLICLLALVLPGIAHSQVVGNGYNNSLIYKIQSDTNTVYLLGSIHVLAEEYYPLTRAFSYAYFNSQKVVFEIDPEILFSPAAAKKSEKYYMLQKGQTLKTVLSPSTYHLLKSKLQPLGIDMKRVQKLKPWVVYLTMSGKFDSSMEFRPDLGIENYFYQKAKDAGKPTGGLETVQDQIEVFDTLPMKVQEAMLKESLAITSSKKRKQAFLHMVKSWHQGNLEGLEELVETMKTYPLFYENLLVQRNKNWVPQIENFLTEKKNVLVIVGAAHLPGEDGLLTLLAEKGYELQRVSYVMP
ncbi:MAG: TraB/GumN family protein [Nitrospirota bacterium]|nr:MAG: TraB/GumN family protein [Nitrospirota bacterium]